MIEEVFCSLSGDSFSPKILMEKTGLPLENCHEVGDKDYWQESFKYGFANLTAPLYAELEGEDDPMSWISRTLLEHHATMLECGVEEFKLWVIIHYEGILNWWITVENMKVFSDLNIVVCLTAYRQEENLEQTGTLESVSG